MTMVRISNDGIVSEYLVKYGLAKTSERERPTDSLETLYMAERFQAGEDLKPLREGYDHSVWTGVSAAEFDRPLIKLDEFIFKLARDRSEILGVN